MGISIQGRTGWASVPNAIGRSRLPHPTVHLLLNLLTHSEGFDASYSTISGQTGMGRATISSALKNLQKLDLVTVKKSPGKTGRFESNSYVFHADRLWSLTPEFVDARLRKAPAGSGNEPGTGSGAELGTGSGNEPAPVQELNCKKEQEETPSKNDQSPLAPQGGGAAAPAAHAAPPTPRTKQAHDLPDGWMPDDHVIDQMRAERPDVDLEAEHRKFMDHWPAQPGARGRKKDWNATWRNWIRNARSHRPARTSPAANSWAAWGMPEMDPHTPQDDLFAGPIIDHQEPH